MGRFIQIGAIKLRNNLIAAPMAGITDVGFRYLASKMGAALTVTEMATSRGIIQGHHRTLRTITTHPSVKPYAVQIFGDDPEIMARAAAIAEDMGADIVDLNAACPVRKVIRSGSGAFLLRDLDRLGRMLKEVRKVLTVPLTLKIRSGWDAGSIVACEVAKMAGDEGLDALALHPRTVMQGFTGRADWNLIRETVAISKIPVIASGDIASPGDAVKVINSTGCAGVMIGRAAMGNPFIFREVIAALEGKAMPSPPAASERCAAALEHLDIMLEWFERKSAVALWRKHLTWYVRGLPDAAKLRNKIFTMWDVEELRELTLNVFKFEKAVFSLAGGASA